MRKLDPVRHASKRLELLEAAATCFARSGLKGATIAQICTAAKISPGHLYHYFSSKEDIISAMAEMRLAALTEAVSRILDQPEPVRMFIRELGRLTPEAERRMTPLSIEVLAEAGRNEAVAAILQAHSQAVRQLLTNVLRNGQSEGQIDPALNAEIAATLLLAIVDGTKGLAIHHPALDEAETNRMVDLLVSRFLKPG